MSDDAPLEYPPSDTEYYPEHLENSPPRCKKKPHVWPAEIMEIMEKVGCRDFDNSSDKEAQSEVKDSDKKGEFVHPESAVTSADATPATNQPVQARPVGNFKIRLPALKPSLKACTTINSKKHQVDLEESENSSADKDKTVTKKKKHTKKKAQLAEVASEPPESPDKVERSPPSVWRKHGRLRKLIEEKVQKSIAVPGFNASVFVLIKNPPKLMRGKTYKSDRHVAQEPCVEGPFTLIRTMQWADFLNEVAEWVSMDKENLRINGLTWGFQKQKAHLPLMSEQAFKTMREQVKAKNGSAMVIFVYHPICKQLQNQGQQDIADPATEVDAEDESRWGKKISQLSESKQTCVSHAPRSSFS